MFCKCKEWTPKSKVTFSPQASPINVRIRTWFPGPQRTHFSPTWSCAHPELPKSWRERLGSCGTAPGEAQDSLLSPDLPLVTGPQAAALCSTPAGSSHRVLRTSSRPASLCLVPRPDHPAAMSPVGDTASPRPSHPANLPACPVLPSTCEPQMGQPLCHLNIGIGSPLAKGAALLSR